jgi:hypothetical protein
VTKPPLSAFATVITRRGVVVGATYFGTRVVASPRAHRFLSTTPGIRALPILRKRYLGRAR